MHIKPRLDVNSLYCVLLLTVIHKHSRSLSLIFKDVSIDVMNLWQFLKLYNDTAHTPYNARSSPSSMAQPTVYRLMIETRAYSRLRNKLI